MIRLKLFCLLVLTAVLSIEPVLHNHPLIPATTGSDSSAALFSSCAACSFGTVDLPAAAPAVRVPDQVAYALSSEVTATPSGASQRYTPSRAPPSIV